MTTEWYCGNQEVKAPLHYKWCGLDDVYLLSGFTRELDEYGEENVSIQNLDGLHRAIGEHLAKHKKALNGNEIRFLRKQMDVSQVQLGEILAVSDQTVARWEKQETEIPGPAEMLLRVIYLTEILQHVNPRELAAKLRELDSGPHDKQVFQSTGEGWQAAA